MIAEPISDLFAATSELRHRLASSELVADVSRRFVELGASDIPRGMDDALDRIVDVCGFARASLLEVSADRRSFWVSKRRTACGVTPMLDLGEPFPLEPMRWVSARLTSPVPFVLSDGVLPGDARAERDLLRRIGVGYVVVVPMLFATELLGLAAFSMNEQPDATLLGALASIARLFTAARDRERAELLLRDRLRFEEMLGGFSTRLMNSAELDATTNAILADFSRVLEYDRANVFAYPDHGVFRLTHEWRDEGIECLAAVGRQWPVTFLPWPLDDMRAGNASSFGPDDTPDEAHVLRAWMERAGVRVVAAVPLIVDGEVRGCIAFQRLRSSLKPNEQQLGRLRLIGDMLAGTLARRDAAASLRGSHADLRMVVEAALDGFALVNDGGTVLEWTPQAARVFEIERAHAVGASFGDVLGLGREQGAPRALWESAQRRPDRRLELTCKNRRGREVSVELSMSMLRSGPEPRFGIFIRDIADEKRAEAVRKTAFDEMSRLKIQIEGERDYLREADRAAHGLDGLVCRSAAMKRVLELVDSVAVTSATALVVGESGVGKELVARAIHAASDRADKPLVKVNCASIPKELFESEFFGHVRGAFTSAHRDRAGRFELADRGTLFLDEVGEIPLDLQPKLLRVLQEGEFERVGDDRTRKVDVRVIAATNRDLGAEVAAGRFRADLYYRLSVFPIEVPPLRERREDVLPLAEHFLASHCRAAGRRNLSFDAEQRALLTNYRWPGNVRELAHVIERAVILTIEPPLRLDAALPVGGAVPGARNCQPVVEDLLTASKLREIERDNIVRALQRCAWRISGPNGAAAMLGVNASTLRARMAAFDIRRDAS